MWNIPRPRPPVASTMNAIVLCFFLLMGTACVALMIIKVVSNIYWEFFYVAGFLIKAQAFKPYKILSCQVLLVLLFCRWRNLEFERLINKPQIRQLGRAEPRHKPWSVQQPRQGFLWLVVLPLWFVCQKGQKDESGRTLKWLLEERWDLSANQGM